MADPLIVDPSGLESAAEALRSAALPPPPPAVTAAGSDAISAAINETMPVIESPVLAGLPSARAALATTASQLTSAATTYADVDQMLAEQLSSHLYCDAETRAPASGSASAATHPAGVSAIVSPDTEPAATLNRLTSTATSLSGSVQGAAQSIQGGLASISTDSARAIGKPRPSAEDAKLGEDDAKQAGRNEDATSVREQAVEGFGLQRDTDAPVGEKQPVASPGVGLGV